MHLIHAHWRALPEQQTPDSLMAWLKASAVPADALEHVSVHPTGPGRLTLGLFHALPRLRDAERAALRLSRRACDDGPLHAYTLLSCGSVMVPCYHNLLLAETPDTGEDGTGQDRFRPGANTWDPSGPRQD